MRKMIPSVIVAMLMAVGFVGRASAGTRPGNAGPGMVLVLRPNVISSDAGYDWLATGLQASLADDLSGKLAARVTQSPQISSDSDSAMKLGSSVKAHRVIIATVQLIDRQLRITGQVLDVTGKMPPAALKATGGLADLFELEDQLASQVRRALASQARPVVAVPQTPIQLSTGPLRISANPVQSGLQYAMPYSDDRFTAQANRYFFQSSNQGCGWGGWGCGTWGYGAWGCGTWIGGFSAYPTVCPRAPF